MGFFRDPFDLDGDGKVDAGESFLEFMIFNEVMNEDGEEDSEKESRFGDIDSPLIDFADALQDEF